MGYKRVEMILSDEEYACLSRAIDEAISVVEDEADDMEGGYKGSLGLSLPELRDEEKTLRLIMIKLFGGTTPWKEGAK